MLPDTKALPYSCEHGFSVANRTAVVCGWHSKAGFSLSAEPACLADECVDVAVGDLASRVVCQVEGDTTRCQYACRDGFISGSARAQRPEQTADYVRGEFLCKGGVFEPVPVCERCFLF